MSLLFNSVYTDRRVTAWSRQSHGQVSTWTLRTILRWQRPLPPNDNWRRARQDELPESAYGSRVVQTQIGRTAMENISGKQSPAIPSLAMAPHRVTPSRLPFGSLRSALTGPRPDAEDILRGGNG